MRLLHAASPHPDVRLPNAGPDADVPLLHATAHPDPEVHLHATAHPDPEVHLHATAHPHPEVHLHAAAHADGPGFVHPATVKARPDGDAHHRPPDGADTAGHGQRDPDDPGEFRRRPVRRR